MDIHDDIRALRDDPVLQRVAQAAMQQAFAGWTGDPAVTELLAEISAFANCRALAECEVLSALFDEESDLAHTIVSGLCARLSIALGGAPFGHVPVRHFADGLIAMLVLAQSGTVTLSLVALDGNRLARLPTAQSAEFVPCEMWDRVLAGTGTARLIERRSQVAEPSPLRSRNLALGPGKIICRDAARQALQIDSVDGCLVSLRLKRRQVRAGVSRELSIADGALVRQTAGNPRDSRIEAMMALAGRMGRADAAPQMAKIAVSDAADGLRWQAVRECLALDTAAGFAALSTLAARAANPLSLPAQSLRDQLVATYPQLAELVRCPA